MPTITKKFRVFRKSENTNSFGLFQMYVMAKDGEAYKTCANSMNVKNIGDVIDGSYWEDPISGNRHNEAVFHGHELTERLSMNAPQDVVKEVWNLKPVV